MTATTHFNSAAPLSSEELAAYLTAKGQKAPQIWTSTMLGGESGTGKTFSAMLLARGLSEGNGFGFVDTENRRGLHYRTYFPEMEHLDMAKIIDEQAGGRHDPKIYEQVIRAMSQRYKVLVIDSFTHAHEGIGGTLWMHEQELTRIAGNDPVKREKNNYSAWGPIKPKERALAWAIASCSAHVILCVRAKPQLVNGQGSPLRKTNLKNDEIPYAFATNKDLIYEMTLAACFRPGKENRGIVWPVKLGDDLAHAIDLQAPLSVRTGELMLEWSRGEGKAKERTAFYNEARAQARKGREHMKTWYAALSPEQRGALKPIADELLTTATAADQYATRSENLFDQPAEAEQETSDEAETDDGRPVHDPEAEARAAAEFEAERQREIEAALNNPANKGSKGPATAASKPAAAPAGLG